MVHSSFSKVLAIATIMPLTAAAQSSGQLERGWLGCANGGPDVVIASCASIVENSSVSPGRRTIAFNNLGNAYFAKGDFDQAIENFSEAIKLSPQFNVAFNNRANAYVAKKDYGRAIEDFNEAIRLNPGHITGVDLPEPFDYSIAFTNRGFAYASLNDYDHAIRDFDEAIRLKSHDSNLFFDRGAAYNARGDYDSAIVSFNKALQINPKNAYALYSRAIAKRNKDDVEGAQADAAAALQIDPKIADELEAKVVPITMATASLSSTEPVRRCQTLPQYTSELAEV
jgi:tetratricopeptide (TPR) repeat protein